MKQRQVERTSGGTALVFRRYELRHPVRGNGQGPAATRDDWKRKPLPEKRATLPLGQPYSAEEFSLIQRGLVPQRLEDQWFIFYEGDALFFHRSWTGDCIYVVHFHATGDEMRATYADINREPSQYSETDDQRDRERVLELIDVLLLQRSVPQKS